MRFKVLIVHPRAILTAQILNPKPALAVSSNLNMVPRDFWLPPHIDGKITVLTPSDDNGFFGDLVNMFIVPKPVAKTDQRIAGFFNVATRAGPFTSNWLSGEGRARSQCL